MKRAFPQIVWAMAGISLANGVIEAVKGNESGVIALVLFVGIALGGLAGMLQD